LAKAAERNRAVVLVLAYCGLRFGEAAALRVADLDLLAVGLGLNAPLRTSGVTASSSGWRRAICSLRAGAGAGRSLDF